MGTGGSKLTTTPVRGSGDINNGYMTTTVSYPIFDKNGFKIEPNITVTPYYNNYGKGVDTRYGGTISFKLF